MSVLNTRMLLKCLNILSKGKVLSSEMSDILSQWFVEVEGSYFSKSYMRNKRAILINRILLIKPVLNVL